MIKTFTPDHIIRYIYNETTASERTEIEKALLVDEDLLDLYTEMAGTVAMLNGALVDPSASFTANLLNFSKSLSLHPAKP
jgi:hypothetical protein